MAVPTDFPNLALWLKADAIGGLADGDPVDTWADSSGNGFDVSGSGTSRPTYRTGIFNGLPAVRFDGSNDNLLREAALISAVPLTVIGVMSATAGGAMLGVCRSDSGGDYMHVGLNTTSLAPYAQTRQGVGTIFTATAPDSAPSGAAVVATAVWAASNSRSARLNGGTAGTNTNNSIPASLNRTSVGALMRSSATSFLTGNIAEIVAYSAALADADRQAIEAYLTAKWIPSSSPTSIPAGILAAVGL